MVKGLTVCYEEKGLNLFFMTSEERIRANEGTFQGFAWCREEVSVIRFAEMDWTPRGGGSSDFDWITVCCDTKGFF